MSLCSLPTDVLHVLQEVLLSDCPRSAFVLSAVSKMFRRMMQTPILVVYAPWILDGTNVRRKQLVVRLYENAADHTFYSGATNVNTRLCPSSDILVGTDIYFHGDSSMCATLIDPRISYKSVSVYDPQTPIRIRVERPGCYEICFSANLFLSFTGRVVTHRESACSGPRDNNDLIEYDVLQLERIVGVRVPVGDGTAYGFQHHFLR